MVSEHQKRAVALWMVLIVGIVACEPLSGHTHTRTLFIDVVIYVSLQFVVQCGIHIT